jgi:hypothetical protein
MLVLICGDRNWKDKDAIEREFISHGLDPSRDVIMEGEAKGADTLAREVAEERGWPPERIWKFPAKWDRFNRAAGVFRNQDMLNQGPDLVLAFHPNINLSKGTRHMVKIARLKGVKVEVFDA